MNFNEGNYRLTFKNSADVVLLSSDSKRLTYWRERGGGHSLYVLHQAKIHYCKIGEPLIVSATTYDGAPTPHGVVANVEVSYHPVFAQDCPELFGPVDDDPGESLTSEELADLFEFNESP